MPTFIDTGEEYLNAAHIISIDTIPLPAILEALNISRR